jgi:NAD(P)-dependent dehydrogenase (short-subunit alcohol dehydrogenase family)
MKLQAGQTAAITGAGSGIGRALAIACARRGLNVALADIDETRLEATAERVGKLGGALLTRRVDVTDRRQVEAFARTTLERFDACHLLFNNAGVLMLGKPEEATETDWAWVLDINLRGTVHGIDAFLPHFLARGREAHIVNTVSLRGIVAGLGSTIYCTSKFGALGLTEALEIDLHDRGVGVTAVCPWAVRTELMEHQDERPEGVTRIAEEYVEALKRSSRAAEVDIWMAPEKVAELTLEGIEQDELYVITHPSCRSLIVNRFERMLASLDRLSENHPELARG